MKKLFFILSLALLNLFSSFAALETMHYKMVYTDMDETVSNDVLNYLESNWDLYSKYLGSIEFDGKPLNVKFYRSRQSFNEALAPQRLPSMRTDYIYLHYGVPSKNALYLYYIPPSNSTEDKQNILSKKMKMALNRHGFLQYMFSVLPTAPAWFREGSALYFESIGSAFVDLETGFAGPKSLINNRDYLKNLKEWATRAPVTLNELLSLSDENFTRNAERNLVYAWGIINYLVSSNQESTIANIVSNISLESTIEENTDNVKAIMLPNSIEPNFAKYIEETKTYSELIDAGKSALDAGDIEKSIAVFKEAILARSDLYSSFYYLGLIAYGQEFYEQSSQYYQIALKNNAPESLINYNLGFVAYKVKDYALATDYFEKAKKADVVRYGAGSDSMIKQIEADKIVEASRAAKGTVNGDAEVNDTREMSEKIEMPEDF